MPCLACTSRLIRIFVHDSATKSLLPYLSFASRKHQYTRRIPTIPTTTFLPSNAQHIRLLTQQHRRNGIAYSQKRLSDDDYLPFTTELPPSPPPPLSGGFHGRDGQLMQGPPPGIPRPLEGVQLPGKLMLRFREDERRRIEELQENPETEFAGLAVQSGGRKRLRMSARENLTGIVRRTEQPEYLAGNEQNVTGQSVIGDRPTKSMKGEIAEAREHIPTQDSIITTPSPLPSQTISDQVRTASSELQTELQTEFRVKTREENRKERKNRRKQMKMLQERQKQTYDMSDMKLQSLQQERKRDEQGINVMEEQDEWGKMEEKGKSRLQTLEGAQEQSVTKAKGERKVKAGKKAKRAEKAIAENSRALDTEALAHLNLPIRGSISESIAPEPTKDVKATTSMQQKTEESKREPPEATVSNRPIYKNRWTLPDLEGEIMVTMPTGKKSRDADPLAHLTGFSKPTPEEILANPLNYPDWQVQRAALARKFSDSPWHSRKRISPGTVALIKAIAAEAPGRLTAREIADRFKVSPEVARRILSSKWVPKTEEEKERRMLKWTERGEKIRAGMMQRGEIWTKEKRRETWKQAEERREMNRLREKFGGKKEEQGKGEEGGVKVMLGRISFDDKIL